MSRLLTSLAALVAAMAAVPASAADWGDDWGGGEDLRGSYINEPKDWSGLGDENDPLKLEFGIRYWYSWGSQSVTSGGVAATATDQSHIGEAHLRIEDNLSNVYVKAWGGYSIAINGTGASTAISDGSISYVGADIGWQALSDGNGNGLGPLIGYMYWNDSPDTGRYNFTTATSAADITYDPVSGQTFVPGDSAPNNIYANMLRLGIQGKASFGDFFDITAEVAAIPYAQVKGQVGADDPTFSTAEYSGSAQDPYGGESGNISSIRSSPTSIDGWGYGAAAELWVGMQPIENLTFRLGGRAWYLQGTADATYTRAFIGDPSESGGPGTGYDTDPTFNNAGFIETNNPFTMLRYGLLGELTYRF